MKVSIFPHHSSPPGAEGRCGGKGTPRRTINLLAPRGGVSVPGKGGKPPVRSPARPLQPWGAPTTPMTGLLARCAGFYLALLPPFAVEHLSFQFRFTAFMDAVLNALLVTWAFFTGGTLLGLFGRRKIRGMLDEIFIGAVTSGMMMSFLWRGPSLLERFEDLLERWLSPASLLLAWGLGVLVTPLKRADASGRLPEGRKSSPPIGR